MRNRTFAGAIALALGTLAAGPALADDPNDPTMRSAANREKDRAIIRELNRGQLAYVQKRDAEYAKGWQAWRAYNERGPEADEGYASARARYERDMAEWRRAVSACRAGRYEYCDRR